MNTARTLLLNTVFILFKKKTTTASILTYIILQKSISNHRLLKEFISNKNKLFTNKFQTESRVESSALFLNLT